MDQFFEKFAEFLETRTQQHQQQQQQAQQHQEESDDSPYYDTPADAWDLFSADGTAPGPEGAKLTARFAHPPQNKWLGKIMADTPRFTGVPLTPVPSRGRLDKDLHAIQLLAELQMNLLVKMYDQPLEQSQVTGLQLGCVARGLYHMVNELRRKELTKGVMQLPKHHEEPRLLNEAEEAAVQRARTQSRGRGNQGAPSRGRGFQRGRGQFNGRGRGRGFHSESQRGQSPRPFRRFSRSRSPRQGATQNPPAQS